MLKFNLFTLFLIFTLKCIGQVNDYPIIPYPNLSVLNLSKYAQRTYQVRKNGINDSLSTTIKETNDYDGLCRLKSNFYINSYFAPDTSNNSYTYDAQNRILSSLSSRYMNGKIINTFRYEYVYKGTSSLIDSIRIYNLENWGNTLFQSSKYTYSGNNITLIENKQITSPSNSYILNEKIIVSYDAKSRVTSKIVLKFNAATNKFDSTLVEKVGYSSLELGFVNSYEQNINSVTPDFTFKSYSKSSYDIKQNGVNPTEIKAFNLSIFQGNTSRDTTIHRYIYDTNKRIIKDNLISLQYNDSIISTINYTYNSNGQIIRTSTDGSIYEATRNTSGFIQKIVTQLYDIQSRKYYINTTDTYEPACASTSVGSEFLNNKVNLYPNPTNNDVTIEFKNEADAIVNIFDIMGKTVFQEKYENIKNINLRLSELKSGIYIAQIYSNNTKLVKKLIISR